MIDKHPLYFAMQVPEFDKFIVHDEPAPEAEGAAAAASQEAEVAGAAALPQAEGAAANVGATVLPSGDVCKDPDNCGFNIMQLTVYLDLVIFRFTF